MEEENEENLTVTKIIKQTPMNSWKRLRNAVGTSDEEEDAASKKRPVKKGPTFSEAIKEKRAMKITTKTQLPKDLECNEMTEAVQENKKGNESIPTKEGPRCSSGASSQQIPPIDPLVRILISLSSLTQQGGI